MYKGIIDLSDVGDKDNHFETRALAAISIMIKCGLDEIQSAENVTDGYHDLGIDAIYLDDAQKTLWLSKVFWGQPKNEIKFGGCRFQPVKLGANFRGLK